MFKPNKDRTYLITYIDILGFEAFLENHSLSEVYGKMYSLLKALKNTKVQAVVEVKYDKNVSKVFQDYLTNIPYFLFSDSVLIYKEIGEDHQPNLSPEDTVFGEMIMSLEEIFKSAFKQRIFIRGGLAYGKAIIQPDSQGINNILVGKPIINAYKTEEAQNWMGCAFHESCRDLIENSIYTKDFLVSYPIPLKNECPILNYALGWVDSSIKDLKSMFENWETFKPHHEVIKSNTMEFFEDSKDRSPRWLGFGIDFHMNL